MRSSTDRVDSSARVRTAHDQLINAPVERVWELQTEVERWPSWQPPVMSVERLDNGPVVVGSQFRWSTPIPASELAPADTLVVSSTVQDVHLHRRLLWSGPGSGAALQIELGVHLWTFTQIDNSTLVHTEETWSGDLVDSHPAAFTAALAASLEDWLKNLKTEAERPLA